MAEKKEKKKVLVTLEELLEGCPQEDYQSRYVYVQNLIDKKVVEPVKRSPVVFAKSPVGSPEKTGIFCHKPYNFRSENERNTTYSPNFHRSTKCCGCASHGSHELK